MRVVNENTSMYFGGNSARKGGAIYNLITGHAAVQSSRACFIVYSDPFEDRSNWRANFTFEDNTSINASNSIFTTSAFPCAKENTDVTKNLSETLLFCHNHYWKFINSDCTDEIQTEGNDYKFTNLSVSSFPGMGFVLPVQVYDDLGHNITSSTGYTSTFSPDQHEWARVDPRFNLISNNYISILGQENRTVVLELQSTGSRPQHLRMEVELLQCPPGSYFEADIMTPDSSNSSMEKCVCDFTSNFGNNLNCSISLQHFEASIPWNFWIGPDPQNGSLLMGEMPNVYSEQQAVAGIVKYRVLPNSSSELDEVVCGGISRKGMLCGKCVANYSTSVNSYNYICMQCDDSTNFVKNIFLFILFTYLPYIILLGAIAYFNLKFTSSATNGFILYAQMLSDIDIFDINGSSRLTIQTAHMRKAYLFVYGIFNFNSFATVMEPFCIRENWTTLDVLCLEYTLAILPILLILLLYLVLRFKGIKFLCCCKSKKLSIQASPRQSSRKKKGKDKSLIHTIVACIVLSYTKITLVSMKILAVQRLFDKEGKYISDTQVYFAGHLSFSSREFLLPYGAVAIFMMLTFVLIPPLFLLGVPQLIDRLLDTGKFPCCKRLWPTVTINIFLDAFQGFYKPKLYCRIFAGLYFVFRLVIAILYVVTSNYLIKYFWQQFFIVLMIVLLAICKPYKKSIFNILDILIFLNLAVVNIISSYVYTSSLTVSGLSKNDENSIYFIQYILLWLPLVYMLSYVGYQILAKFSIAQRFHRKRHQDFASTRSDYRDSDSRGLLTDSALFSRAEATNNYHPQVGNPPRTLEDVNKQSARVENTPGDFERRGQIQCQYQPEIEIF